MLVKLIRRWRIQAYLDLMWMTRDFKLFLINVVSDVLLSLAAVAAAFLLAERFGGIGVWSRDQIVFMLGYAAVVNGIKGIGFSYNILGISRRVGRGQMDHTLIQPQPIWMVLLTEGFTPFTGLPPLLAGLGILGTAIVTIGVPDDLWWWVVLVCNLLASCTIVLAFSFAWGSVAFWAPVGAEEISSRVTKLVTQLQSLPLDNVGPLMMNTLMTVLPVGFVAWYPSQALLGLRQDALWITPIVAVVTSLVAFIALKRGLKKYEHTGSQRYRGFGHRN